MKKIILLIAVFFALNSCTTSSETDRNFVVLPIESVEMPTNYTIGNISKIKINYKRPTECHIFNGFYIADDEIDSLKKTIAVQSVKLNNSNCQADDSLFEVFLDFKPTVAGTYTFKFWLGLNGNGSDEYETYVVEVL
ncbi:hypothetical protein [Flavobacterium sp.]|uniref:hypothetical protein n=1 Tax=Flavobacterium sp. TaxID=239 RepID=UPI003751FD5F